MEPVYRFTHVVLVTFMRLMFHWRLDGVENIPRTGSVIIAGNHISYLDPLCQGYLVSKRRRTMRFFAKSELWKNPFLRFILGNAHQIPVQRGTGESGPVEGALKALGRGDCVIIYPESTITTNADLTPMRGKTGIARVAIASGAPIVPIAVWGSHWVKPKRRKAVQKWRRVIMCKAAEPLSFAHLRGSEEDHAVLREVTDQIMAELDRLVRELHKVYPEGAAVPELRES